MIRKRLPALAGLHRDDESVLLWLVDDGDGGEPGMHLAVADRYQS
ncbi:hypothetical protein ACN6K8_003494 [[Kitasatospora] papulosa]